MDRQSFSAHSGRTWVTVLIILVALAAGIGGTLYYTSRNGEPADHSSPRGESSLSQPSRVSALGRLQPVGGVIPVYGPPGDRIKEMKPLSPGMHLKSGEPIATLASREQREGDVKIAEVQLQEAKDALKASKEAGQKKIDAAQADLDQLVAGEASDLKALDAKAAFVDKQRTAAVKMLDRLEKLKKEEVRVADEDLDKSRLAVAQADAELIGARAAKDKAAISYKENKKAANARLAAARAELTEAEARAPIKSSEEKLTQAKKTLDLTILKAPVDGTVLKVTGREGQPTGVDPIIQMANLTEMTVVAEVYESDVERVAAWVRKGPVPAEVVNTALPRPLKGTVQSDRDIARMIARNQVLPVGPREDADRRVVEVTAHLDAESSAIAARFVGLQATVTLGAK
jgi:HlyD family secretion protein